VTLSTTTCRASFNGTGTTGPFSFSFPFNDDTEIVAFTITDNVVTDLLSSQYTITGAGESTGGTLTTTSAVASGTTLVVMRTLPLTQTTDLENTGAFYGETHEDTFDRITMQIQQLKEEINRCLRMPKGVSSDQELSAARAGCYPFFDADGVLTYVTSTSFTASTLLTVFVTAPTYEIPAGETEVLLINSDAADVTVSPQSGDTIETASTLVLTGQYEAVHLVLSGTNWYRV